MNPSNASNPQSSPGESSSAAAGASGASDQESRLTDVGRKAKELAKDTASQFKDKASSMASQAKERAAEIAGDQKEGLADRLGKASSSVHESAKKFEEEDPNIAWITHEAANRIQKVADYVRGSDLGTIQDDAEDLVRRYPIVCLGGLFVAGLVVGNLLKATANPPPRPAAAEGKRRSAAAPSGVSPESTFVAPKETSPTGGATLSGPPPAETMS
jgi:gas vesicle protein